MNLRSYPIHALAGGLVALALTACGQTRFVVVQSPPAGQAAAVATTSAPATTAAAPVAPGESTPTDVTDVTQPAVADDPALVAEAIDLALLLDGRTFEDHLAHFDGADDLAPTWTAAAEVVADLDVDYQVTDVLFEGDFATATVDVLVDGEPFATALPVELVRGPDQWLVTRAGACTILALASPCPET